MLCVVLIQQGDGITISDIDDASCEVELRVVPEPLELAGSGVAGGGVVTDIDSRALVGAARSLRVTSEQATS
jgi:acyl-coenzyme A thioesterase PaaI-like protein